jgi:hypothetical protein
MAFKAVDRKAKKSKIAQKKSGLKIITGKIC